MKRNFVDKLAGLALFLYIVCATAFGNNADTSKWATYTLYSFLFLGALYILQKKKVIFNYYNIATFSYGALLFFSFFYAVDQQKGLEPLYWFFTCAVLTFLVINYVDTQEKISMVIHAYISGGLTLSMYALSIYGWEIFDKAAKSTYGIRFGGELGNENFIGLACSFSILFSVYKMIYTSYKKRFYLLYLSTIVSCFTFAMLTGSKKALFLIIVGTIALFLFKNPKKNVLFHRLKYIGISIAILFIFNYIIKNVEAFWYINSRMEEFINILLGNDFISASDQRRLFMVGRGWEAFLEHPYFGNGVASSRYFFNTYSHNNYIEILMNTGTVGFAIYYSSYFISVRRLLKINDSINNIRIIALICMVVSLILEVGLVLYYTRYNQILFAVISAFVTMHYINNSNKNRSENLSNGKDKIGH